MVILISQLRTIKKKKNYGPRGNDINILDLLNEKNGYLDNGTLSIEYGIHIDRILRDDGIWEFNFNDKLFVSDDFITIEYEDLEDDLLKNFYGHKQLLRFHSPFFQNQVTEFISMGIEEECIEKCLQIAHGVRIPLDDDAFIIATIAFENKLKNVVQYVDHRLVEECRCPKKMPSHKSFYEHITDFGLRHLLTQLINHFACLEELKSMIQKLEIQQMSGEVMKTFVSKILNEKSQEIDQMLETVEDLGIDNVSGKRMKTFVRKVLYGKR